MPVSASGFRRELRGNAGSETTVGHIEAARLARAQLPRGPRIRAGSGGGADGFLTWLTAKSRRLHYSVGMTITDDMRWSWRGRSHSELPFCWGTRRAGPQSSRCGEPAASSPWVQIVYTAMGGSIR